MPRRLKVELPVCPEKSCSQVGKVAFESGLSNFCVGSVQKGTAHKKRKMVPVLFTGSAPEVEGA
jgi:hypothetical protein